MMKISPIFAGFKTPYPQKQNSLRFLNQIQYDTFTFTGSKKPTVQERMQNLPEEEFPSKGLRDFMLEELSNPNNTLGVIDLHKLYYADLEDAQTLEEAKEMYPEFQEVTDAKEVEIVPSSTLQQVKEGKIEGLTLENLSLEFLKNYYARFISTTDEDSYFGIKQQTLSGINKKLNIGGYKKYFKILNSEKVANNTREGWKDKEYREKHLEYWTEERRKEESETTKAKWQDEEFRKKQKNSWTPERRAERSALSSKIMAEMVKNPNYAEQRRQAWTPEMKEEARKRGIALWDEENADDKTLKEIQARRKAASERTIALWQTEEFRAKQEAGWTPERRLLSALIMAETMEKCLAEPEYRQMMSEIRKQKASDPEYLRRASEISTALWQNPVYRAKQEATWTPERRALSAEISTKLWQDEAYRLKQEEAWTPERKADNGRKIRENNSKPDAILLRQLITEAQKEAWRRHPECGEKYKSVASSFPRLAEIIAKQRRGEPLSENEEAYSSIYFAACHELFPEVVRITGQEKSEIFKEWGIKDRDSEKMQKIMKDLGII